MSDGGKRPRTLEEFRLALRVLAVLVLIRLLLPGVKLRRLVGWAGHTDSTRSPRPVPLQTVAWYTDALLHRMPARRPGNCLPRSLTLLFFASRAGLPVRFHCGVRREGDSLEGHAWLTLGGQLFLEPGDPEHRYAVTFSYPEPDSGEISAETLALQGESG